MNSSIELLEEPQVVPIEEADVVDAVLDHGDPLRTHAEGESIHLIGVVADVPQHTRMHHTRAEKLDPA